MTETGELFKSDLFCVECLILDSFFVDGGSWIPDRCPKCKGTDCILYEDMTPEQKAKAHIVIRQWRNW